MEFAFEFMGVIGPVVFSRSWYENGNKEEEKNDLVDVKDLAFKFVKYLLDNIISVELSIDDIENKIISN